MASLEDLEKACGNNKSMCDPCMIDDYYHGEARIRKPNGYLPSAGKHWCFGCYLWKSDVINKPCSECLTEINEKKVVNTPILRRQVIIESKDKPGFAEYAWMMPDGTIEPMEGGSGFETRPEGSGLGAVRD